MLTDVIVGKFRYYIIAANGRKFVGPVASRNGRESYRKDVEFCCGICSTAFLELVFHNE
jgi:hypothetical protein